MIKFWYFVGLELISWGTIFILLPIIQAKTLPLEGQYLWIFLVGVILNFLGCLSASVEE